MVESLNDPILAVVLPCLILAICIIYKETAVFSKIIPIILCLLSCIYLVLLPLYLWSVPVYLIYCIIILVGVERSVMLEINVSFVKVKNIWEIITFFIAIAIASFFTWFLLSNKYIYIQTDLDLKLLFSLLFGFALIVFCIYYILLLFLLHYINPLWVLSTEKNSGKVKEFFELFGNGEDKQNIFMVIVYALIMTIHIIL